jgi:hypothetical protein
MLKINPIKLRLTEGELQALLYVLDNLDFKYIATANDLNAFTILTIWQPLKKAHDKFKTGASRYTLDIGIAASLYIVLNGEISAPCIRVRLELEKYMINTYYTLDELLNKNKS